MPNEIPDSDEESDYEARPEKPTQHLLSEKQDLLSIEERGIDVNFDDFISQSQSAKDGSSQLGQTKRSTASTQKHLRNALENRRGSASSSYDRAGDMNENATDVSLPPSAVGKRKRAHSETGDGHAQKPSSQNRAKRIKTYGANSRRTISTQNMRGSWESAAVEHTMFLGPSAEMLPPQIREDEEDIAPQARNGPENTISRFTGSVSSIRNLLSMSRSSMGGYQSFSLDYRGPGVDIDANPFVDELSQASVNDGIEHTQADSRKDLSSTVPLSTTPRRPGRDDISPFTDDDSQPLPLAETSISVDPSLLTFQPPEELQMLTSPAVTVAAATSASTFMATSAHESGESQLEVETVSNHTDENTASKKRGHKSKPSRQPSHASIQNMTTDQLDDEGFDIGLPKEQYQARPSKSRGSTTEPERHRQPLDDDVPTKKRGRKKSLKAAPKEADHSSPVKLPTSELNLSDEAIIGLPKENYKPRPSRRRSRMIAEDDEASIEVDTSLPSVDPEQPVQSQQSKRSEASHTLEAAEAPTPKPKKGKKAKVKRAKTSAAGLLKKSEPMISDGEDDVLWMETKPAKVKLDLPADTLAKKALNDEHVAEPTVTVEASTPAKPLEGLQESSKPPNSTRSKMVTVEIPARPEKDQSEPKKRGRKPKAIPVDEEDDPEAKANELTTSTPASNPSSTILKEKHSNTTLPHPTPKKTTESSSPSKPARITHSPINPSGGKVLYRIGLSRRSAIPPLLKIVKPPAKAQVEKENLDEEGRPRDLVAETMRKWRELGVLD
jgi:hypothetical protein